MSHLTDILHANRIHLYAERVSCGLDGTELTDSSGYCWIAKYGYSQHTWRDLLKKFQPFPAKAVFKVHKASSVAARPRQVTDDAGTDWIGDTYEYDW